MSTFDEAISIHPYFTIHEGQMDACRGFLTQFCEKVGSEEKCLYYDFTFQGNTLFCREAYRDVEGVQSHLENCGALLEEFLKIADVRRVEIHGPAEALEKLKPVFEAFEPEYFTCACGSGR